MKSANINQHLAKGFTLIELLIVIVILAILTTAVVVTIDPIDKINNGNDTKVISDLEQISQAEQSYATHNNGTYATAGAPLTSMQTQGDLKYAPVAPGGYAAYTITAAGADVIVAGQLKSKKYTGAAPSTPFYVYCSSNGKIGPSTANNVCPP